MKKRIILVISLIFLIGVLISDNSFSKIFKSSTAFAIGDLTVNWGVPEGNPIFVVSNIVPGGTESRTVQVSNGGISTRLVGVRGIEASDSGNLSDVMEITITEGVTDLYGGTTGVKTLTQFFSDSGNINGIALSNLAPGGNTSYVFKVKFKESAGNEYQGKTIVFDLKIGITVNIPAECSGITFSGSPIFGTSNSETIRGTNKNDLIFAFEGNDKVFGLSGKDCIVGGAGNDELRGELGEDFIFGNEGNDLLIGANGKDFISGGIGNDQIKGETGEDTLYGEGGDDDIKGGSGNDLINGGEGNDLLNGEAGSDEVLGEAGNDDMKGGSGGDDLIGGADTDKANGEAGKDSCIAEIEISCEI